MAAAIALDDENGLQLTNAALDVLAAAVEAIDQCDSVSDLIGGTPPVRMYADFVIEAMFKVKLQT